MKEATNQNKIDNLRRQKEFWSALIAEVEIIEYKYIKSAIGGENDVNRLRDLNRAEGVREIIRFLKLPPLDKQNKL